MNGIDRPPAACAVLTCRTPFDVSDRIDLIPPMSDLFNPSVGPARTIEL